MHVVHDARKTGMISTEHGIKACFLPKTKKVSMISQMVLISSFSKKPVVYKKWFGILYSCAAHAELRA
jgi:hypothetical protein